MEPWGIVFPSHYLAPPGYTQLPDTYSMEQVREKRKKEEKKIRKI